MFPIADNEKNKPCVNEKRNRPGNDKEAKNNRQGTIKEKNFSDKK